MMLNSRVSQAVHPTIRYITYDHLALPDLIQGVVDLSWAPDGLTLLAASTDGTITALQFTTADLAPLASKKVRRCEPITCGVSVWQGAVCLPNGLVKSRQ